LKESKSQNLLIIKNGMNTILAIINNYEHCQSNQEKHMEWYVDSWFIW